MDKIHKLFFELIRVALGNADSLSRMPNGKEWQLLFDIANKQSLIGICFAGIQRLGADADEGFARVGLSEMLYFTWMGLAYKIQMRNELMDGYTEEVRRYFNDNGYPCMILKGQAIAKLYKVSEGSKDAIGEMGKTETAETSLAALRQSGDVDVWVKMSRKELFEWSKKKFGEVDGYNGMHIHCAFYKDAEVEAHFIPGRFSNPFCNRIFQKFCELHEPTSSDALNIPFNLVYILQHSYNHFKGHGVGFRQIMDYYFVLQQSFKASETLNSDYKAEAMDWIKRMGMSKFCKAVMWVMLDVFGMKRDCLLCEPDEELGRFLLSEIMATGNMGHHDKRVKAGTWSTAWGRYCYNMKRTLYITRICPGELLWRPWISVIDYVKNKCQKLQP